MHGYVYETRAAAVFVAGVPRPNGKEKKTVEKMFDRIIIIMYIVRALYYKRE